uniref:Thioredoxin domain-containing protein n=1 Tax=viral metagenome TaxID=1070528 RepID=A0A6C0EJF4_9ZZZZ
MTDSKYSNSDVIELSSKDFNNKILINSKFKNKNGLIKFYAPWCPHCVEMTKPLKFLATELKNKGFLIGVVNTDIHPKVAQTFNINGIPTIYTLNTNGDMELYNEGKDIESLLNHITKFTNLIIT